MSEAFHEAVRILQGTPCVWSEEAVEYINMTHSEAVIAAAALAGQEMLVLPKHHTPDMGVRKDQSGMEPE